MAQEVPPVVVDDSEPRLAAWRTREAPKNDAGQIYCDHPDCHDHIFKRRSEWTKHMDKHDRPYKCTNPGCNQRFTLAACMRRHLWTIHQANSKWRWMCPYSACDRSFSRKADLKIHIHRFHTKPDSIESLRAEITRLQREAMQRDSRLDKMEMKLKQQQQQQQQQRQQYQSQLLPYYQQAPHSLRYPRALMCNCSSRKTDDELYQFFITSGTSIFNWDHEESQVQDIRSLYWQFPIIRDEVNALIALHVQCCWVSSLASVDRAITKTRDFLTSPSANSNPKVSVFTMILLAQISMRAGYPWTHHLPQILSLLLAFPVNVSDAVETDICSRLNLLEILGGLDMDVWIVGRRSEAVHIWATYCSGREGIEKTTGLPRPLLDLIARLSRNEDVAVELLELLLKLPPESDDYASNVHRCFILTALLQLHSRVRPMPDVDLLIKNLLDMMRCLHAATDARYNQRVLIWPAYVVGCYVREVEDRSLVENTLLQVRIPDRPSGPLAPEESVLVMSQQLWDERLSIGENDAFQKMQAQFPDLGLW
ncbi:hypothetical protein PAAG_04144 [Paracoccidioides lutzii Pb01]|uniref:C2H2-type domain-containing protein n=1 Tax=Paracoccidioides lutzii (strain ATCC MYA-826 / Pb01) TaxID=502779 RepID=C1H050_PARBA|nr:hypothetical protein PAAG_04144 [Paracoccidioides lutzii Pb01]EEH33091.2 hypothetical protein PAAG_04144 [Paracoccidioides lutzii Pb01]